MEAPTRLLDAYGRPVQRRELKTEQAEPGLTGVRQAWVDSVASGLTPQRMAQILSAAAQGDLEAYLVLAEEMEERDPHYAAVLGVRKRAVSGIKPVIKAASEDTEDERIAEAVRAQIEDRDDFPDLIEDLLDGLGKGFAVVEHIWKTSGRSWDIGRLEYCDPRFFQFDRETGRELRLRDESAPIDGLPLSPFKYVVHRPKLKSGLTLRGGLARLVAFGWLCKAYSVKDWVAFVECYGLPLRVGKYGPEATKDDVETLHRAVANIGTDAAAVLPKSMEIEFEAIANGTGNNIFENLARWVDEQISKAVLGQTMTSDDGSSMAQAEVHDNVRHDILVADARQVVGPINRDLIRPFVDLNFGPQERYPKLILPVDEQEDITALVSNVTRLAEGGMAFKAKQIREKLKLDDPDDDDEIFGGFKEPADPPAATNALASLAMNRSLGDIEEAGLEDWQQQIDPLIVPIEDIIASASSYDEAIERLSAAVPNMDTAALIDALVKASFQARAEGDAPDDV